MINQPDATGHFGAYGGRFVPETLVAPLDALTRAFVEAQADPRFQTELTSLLVNYAGRPTPLFFARRGSQNSQVAQESIVKRKIFYTRARIKSTTTRLGQVLLAQRMSKRRIIAETGAGQHGVATATVCSLFWPRLRGLHGL